MKLLSFILILTFFITSCNKEKSDDPTIVCVPSGLENNLLVFYPFSNGSTLNYLSNSNHLSNNTTAHTTTDRNGNSNCAFEFDNIVAGSDEFIYLNEPMFLNNLTEFSVSIWYLPKDTVSEESKFETLIMNDMVNTCPNNLGDWAINLYDCKKALFSRDISVWDIMSNQNCSDEVDSRMFNWQHSVATFNNGTMKIYRNGVLQEMEIGDADCSQIASNNLYANLYVGKNFTGTIDDIMIFNKELSSQEISDLYSSTPCCFN